MSDAPRKKLLLWPRLIIYPLLLTVLYFLILPPGVRVSEQARKAQARLTCRATVTGLSIYRDEYDHWPDFTGDGLFLDKERQAHLIRVLSAKDEVNNPRKIMFIDRPTASDSPAHYYSSIDAKTGTLLDPWGQPYRIALDTTGTGTIANPYPDDGPISASVIVWSLGKDGRQGAPANPRTAKGSDDICSWQ